MAIFRRKTREPEPDMADLAEQMRIGIANAALAEERFAASYTEAILAEHDGGPGPGSDGRFDATAPRAILKKWLPISRHAYLRTPLIGSACDVIAHYVWGKGVEREGRDEDANAVVQDLFDDKGMRRALTRARARVARDSQLTYEGNIFFALYRNPGSGRVTARVIPTDQVTDIVCDPEDSTQPWLYRRRFTSRRPTNAGELASSTEDLWLPAYDYFPTTFPASLDGAPVRADINTGPVIYHLAIGGLADSVWGLPKTLSVLDWARAYKDFLSDWSSVVRSLSRFAWRATTPRWKSARVIAELESRFGVEGASAIFDENPPPTTGSVAAMSDDVGLTPIPKTGATISADDAKALRLMVDAGMGIPDPILSGDPAQGTLATAKSLDRPTELMMMHRQAVWSEVFADLGTYAIESAAIAPAGQLSGQVTFADGHRMVTYRGDFDPTIDVRFPPLLEHDVDTAVRAVATVADILEGSGADADEFRRFLTREALSALGSDDIDDTIDRFFPDGDASATAAAESEARRIIEALTGA